MGAPALVEVLRSRQARKRKLSGGDMAAGAGPGGEEDPLAVARDPELGELDKEFHALVKGKEHLVNDRNSVLLTANSVRPGRHVVRPSIAWAGARTEADQWHLGNVALCQDYKMAVEIMEAIQKRSKDGAAAKSREANPSGE